MLPGWRPRLMMRRAPSSRRTGLDWPRPGSDLLPEPRDTGLVFQVIVVPVVPHITLPFFKAGNTQKDDEQNNNNQTQLQITWVHAMEIIENKNKNAVLERCFGKRLALGKASQGYIHS